MKKLFLVLFIVSCSSTKYKAPSVVFNSPISPSLDIKEQKKHHNFKSGSKLLIFYQNYNLFEFADTPGLAEGIELGIDIFINKLEDAKLFSSIEKQSLSHISINNINTMLELARRHNADYFILISSSYNYYRYAYTLGYFIAWFPILNYFTPIYSSTASLYIQIDSFTKDGLGLFSTLTKHEEKENLAIDFNKQHLLKLAKNLNYNGYIKAYNSYTNKLLEARP